MRSLRRAVADAVDLETLRIQARCLGCSDDQVAWLEAEAERASWLPLHEAMRRQIVALQLGAPSPAAPVTTVEHFAVLRVQVRRLRWTAVLDGVALADRWVGRLTRGRARSGGQG